MQIEYGAQVLDRNDRVLGMVDYIIRNTLTGEISKFKVSTELVDADLFFTPEDVLHATPDKIKVRFSAPEEKRET